MALSIRVVDTADGGGTLQVACSDLGPNEQLLCAVDGDNGTTASAPAGWTQRGQGSTGGWNMCRIFQMDTPANGTYNFANSSGSDGSAILFAIDGDGVTFDDAAGNASNVAPSVTASKDDSLLVCYFLRQGSTGFSSGTIPSGMSTWLANHQSGGWGNRLGTYETVGSGATGTRTSSSGGDPVSFSLVFSEEAGATPVEAEVSLEGTGSLSVAGRRIRHAATDLSGEGALAAGAGVVRAGAVSLAGTGSLTADADVIGGVNVVTAAASLTGAGTCQVVAAVVYAGSATLTGVATLLITVPPDVPPAPPPPPPPVIATPAGISDEFRGRIGQSHRIELLVQVLDPDTGGVLRTLDTVTEGTVTLDSSAAIRGRCELTVADDGTIIPSLATDDLAPYGNEIQICRGIRYLDGTAEVVSLGVFRLRSVEAAEEDDQGRVLRLTGLDRWSRIVDARFEEPYQIAAGTNFTDAILATVQAVWPAVPHDLGAVSLTTPTLSAEAGEDRGQFLQALATSLGRRLYFDGGGTLRLSPIATTSGTASWELSEGDDGVLLTAAKTWDVERVYNRVIASGEAIDDTPPVRAVATDENPQSPTYYFGPFGRRPRFYVSQMITTEAQAIDAAWGILSGALGASQQVRFGSVVNPAIEPNQVVRIRREPLGIDETHVVDQVTIPLSAEEPMTGQTRVTEVLGS